VKKALAESGRNERAKVGIVGMITNGVQAEELLETGKGDAILVARAFQQNLGLVWDWAGELGMEVRVANQIGWVFGQRLDGGVKSGNAGAARG
jgi:2,4-dienoyl-CoA reductase-like NADH-dependent reductase (Old Yellow Enzyme family)